MAYFDTLVSGAYHVTHPLLKPLVDKLGEFDRQFFVVDSHLRRFGLGYLCVTDRYYEWFTAALGPQSGETPEETRDALAGLEAEIGKLDEMLACARELVKSLVPQLPEKHQESMRTKQLANAVQHADRLRLLVHDRLATVKNKHGLAQ